MKQFSDNAQQAVQEIPERRETNKASLILSLISALKRFSEGARRKIQTKDSGLAELKRQRLGYREV